MSIFWTMFWLGFLCLPLILLLASVFTDNGSAASNSHIWVYKGSQHKVKDATVEEVWKRQHPGKSWEKRQSGQYFAFAIFLGIAFLFFLSWLASKVFDIPSGFSMGRLVWQVGAPILGGCTAGIFYAIQVMIGDYKSGLLKVLHILALVTTAVAVIGALVFTFMKRPLPISQNWIWASAGATALFLILDKIFSGAKKQSASKGGGNLEDWVNDVISMLRLGDRKHIRDTMTFATIQLQMGELDWQIRDEKFFKQTEAIVLDLVHGKAMSIQDQDIYYGRDDVIKAVQAFYFYSVDKFDGFDMHPRIKKALSKK